MKDIQHKKRSKKTVQNMITSALVSQRQQKQSLYENYKQYQTKTTLSSMIFLAHLMYNEREGNGNSESKKKLVLTVSGSGSNDSTTSSSSSSSSSSGDGGIRTRSIRHTSKLSDSATFEFERREHHEVTNDELLHDFENTITDTKTIITTDEDKNKKISYFVNEEFHNDNLDVVKDEMDDLMFYTKQSSNDLFSNSSNNNNPTQVKDSTSSIITQKEDKKYDELTMEEKQEKKKEQMIDKYSQSTDIGDQAFAILLKLNMVELTPDPDDPDYDDSLDDVLVGTYQE